MTALPRSHAYAEGLTADKHGHMSKDSGQPDRKILCQEGRFSLDIVNSSA